MAMLDLDGGLWELVGLLMVLLLVDGGRFGREE